jgi:Rod binding domain-containing protein
MKIGEPSVHASVRPSPAAAKGPDRKILSAAREFEGLLLASVLGPLERSFSAISGDAQVPGSEAYQSLGMQAVAGAMANHGGIGIAEMVARSLLKSESHR